MHASILQRSTLQCNGINTIKSAELEKKREGGQRKTQARRYTSTCRITLVAGLKSDSLERLHEMNGFFRSDCLTFHASSVLWITSPRPLLSKGNQLEPCFFFLVFFFCFFKVVEDQRLTRKKYRCILSCSYTSPWKTCAIAAGPPNRLRAAERKIK